MKTKQVLIRLGQLITFLFADRGLALARMAPPGDDFNGFTLWFAKLLTLIALLLMSALLRKKKVQQQFWLWTVVGALGFVGTGLAGFSYRQALDDKTFEWPPNTGTERYVGGSVWQPAALAEREKSGLSPAQIVDRFGGLPERDKIWTHESIVANERSLIWHFLALVLLIAITVFGLTEGALVKTRVVNGRRKPA